MSSYNTKKDLKEALKKYNIEVDINNKKNDSIDTVIWDLRDVINANGIIVEDLEKSQDEAVKKANTYKKKYSDLLKQKPETLEGKLELEKQKVTVLLDENKSLEDAITACDSVKFIQGNTIETLEFVIVNKDIIISNKDDIIRIKDKQLELTKKETRKLKRKAFFVGAGGGIVVGALLILLL